PLSDNEIAQLYELLHGQPYLTRKAFYEVKSGMSTKQLFQKASQDDGPFADHLRNYFLRLLDYPELSAALKLIVKGQDCRDERVIYRLEAAGLVLVPVTSGKTIPRCRLYEQYFRRLL